MKWPLMFLLIASLCLPALADSDQGVLEILNRDRSGKERLTSEQLKIVHPETFPDLVVVGIGDKERPYILARVIWGQRSLVPRKAAGEALRQVGWAQAEPEQREQLAESWLKEVMWSFGQAPLAEGKGYPFGRDGVPRFQAPQFYRFPDGALRYIAWIQQPQGAEVSVTFRQMLYHFSGEGELILVKMLDRVVLTPGS